MHTERTAASRTSFILLNNQIFDFYSNISHRSGAGNICLQFNNIASIDPGLLAGECKCTQAAWSFIITLFYY